MVELLRVPLSELLCLCDFQGEHGQLSQIGLLLQIGESLVVLGMIFLSSSLIPVVFSLPLNVCELLVRVADDSLLL